MLRRNNPANIRKMLLFNSTLTLWHWAAKWHYFSADLANVVLAHRFETAKFLYNSVVFQIQSFVQLRYVVCDVGYVGDDCSLATDAVPVISSFRRGCTCDVRQFSCGRVFVAATDIYNSDTLTCRTQSTKSRVSNTRRRIRTVNMPSEVSSQCIQAAM